MTSSITKYGRPVVGRAGVEHPGDVGVVHHRQRLALGLEARDHLPRVHAELDDLERDLAADGLALLGHEDRAEAALAELSQELVAADDRSWTLVADDVRPILIFHGSRALSQMRRAARLAAARTEKRQMRRMLLRVFLGSIALNAALAVWALLSSDFGNLEGKILLTSLCVSGASVLALLCGPAFEQRRLGPAPAIGALLSVVGFALLVIGVWTEFASESLAKTAGSMIAVGAALALACLLSLCRLAPRFEWARTAAYALGLLLAAVFDVGVWREFNDGEWYRWIGVLSVLVAACTLAVPVMHVASRRELAAAPAADARIKHCPCCGAPVAAASGEPVTCPRCRAPYRVLLGA